ncbi:unnamed protein product [Bursaphelenchus okinawaensis]|uniref:PLD phosphodiesterase domain-containing protein n=1 Tax=Bursaphelenchus okinawaensis TaxID=465554 RepID=A0A811L3Q1_9BILA|nr:unnamed protein product [Bursaphelenchus okinawaensis]CAG9118664.1 unnamed protein product [Bursaphelenchus okinawaensis]
MPIGLYVDKDVKRLKSTYDSWMELMYSAEESIEIGAMYWSLLARNTDSRKEFPWDPSCQEGTNVYNKLKEVAKSGVKIRIAQDGTRNTYPESDELVREGLAEVRSLNFTILENYGILHSKFWIVDGKHLYIGSANHDWRSLTQVKEMGVLVKNCPCLASDLGNIFETYWKVGIPNAKVPEVWSSEYTSKYNSENPISTKISDDNSLVYLTTSPPSFAPAGREHDGLTIINNINNAKKYIYISVMDYSPSTFYRNNENVYWPDIDDALRSAAYGRRVHVRLLVSKWQSTRKEVLLHLKSLQDINSILPCVYDRVQKKCVQEKGSVEVKIFEVPKYNVTIPYGRVNHAKYMVSDYTATMCTSNWSADYFLNSAGVSFVVQDEDAAKEATLVKDLREIFERDWNSEYATELDKVLS